MFQSYKSSVIVLASIDWIWYVETCYF